PVLPPLGASTGLVMPSLIVTRNGLPVFSSIYILEAAAAAAWEVLKLRSFITIQTSPSTANTPAIAIPAGFRKNSRSFSSIRNRQSPGRCPERISVQQVPRALADG